MKLAALGVVTTALGIGLRQPGLIGIGLYWVLLGPIMRQHGKHLTELQEAAGDGKPDLGGGVFAYGTLLWALLGIPSLLVGILLIGIDADHEGWRWLPIALGGFALGVGGLAAIMYLLGGAALAVGDKLDGGARTATIPAVIRIRSMRETGTFINERPRLEFVLGVEPDPGSGVAAYEVTKKATVPFTAMGSLKVGSGFRATVAGPEDPTAMEIAWDEPVDGAVAAGADDVQARLDALEQLKRDGAVSEAEYVEQRDRILGTL